LGQALCGKRKELHFEQVASLGKENLMLALRVLVRALACFFLGKGVIKINF